MIKLILPFLLIATWGCSPQRTDQIPEQFQHLENLTFYSPNVKPPETISFKKEAIYGDSIEGLIGRMGDITVDRLGRVFIADVQKQAIYVFESDGQFVAQLGRKGRGPSEFSYINSLQIRKDRLYAFDPMQHRVHVFTLDTLAGDKTILLAGNRGEYEVLSGAFPWIDELYVRNDDTYIAKFIIQEYSQNYSEWQNVETKGLFYLLDKGGNISSKVFDFENDIRTVFIGFFINIKDFFGRSMTVLSSNNNIYLAESGHFLIKEYSPKGAYQRAFYYPNEKILLTKESAIEAEFAVEAEIRDLIIRNMNSMDLPETWPVLTDMKIDNQDRLWIATTIEDMNVYEWWVLEETGEFITRFVWPRDEPIEVVKNGYMYTRKTYDETGLQQIVQYRFELN